MAFAFFASSWRFSFAYFAHFAVTMLFRPLCYRLQLLAVSAPIGLCPVLTAVSSQAAEAIRIEIDPAISYQTINGFGASDAWQCAIVGKNWPLEKRARVRP
jgi:hypothetical protein